jgi:hypothetical protein
MNQSEIFALELFKALGAEVSPIPTQDKDGIKTPDFVVKIGLNSILVEVKEIVENAEEQSYLRRIENGEIFTIDKSEDYNRFANPIKKANKQLKAKRVEQPCITLIQDMRCYAMRSRDPQETLHRAMFGEEVLWISQPSFARSLPTCVTDHTFGKGKMINKDSNTSTSAVGLMHKDQDGNSILWLHHNPFSTYPLPVGIFSSPFVKEFRVSSTDKYSSFKEVGNLL